MLRQQFDFFPIASLAEELNVKALVLREYRQLKLEEVPTPIPAPDEVLVQVQACGICGSDIHGFDGSTGRRIPPIIMGHEAAGVVTSLGTEVSRFKIGDRITFDSTISCGKCFFCRSGRINLCDARCVLGVSCGDYRRHGAFAEFVTVPERICYRIPDSLSFEHASMIEAVAVAVHAASRAAAGTGDVAVIVGAGMIGMLVIQAIRLADCSQIIAVDLNDSRLQLALAMGATCALNAHRTDVPAEVSRLTDGRGADVVLEVVGARATVKTAIACARKGGTVTLVGNLTPEVPISLQSVVTRELSIAGSCASNGEYPACLRLMENGDIQVGQLISATAALRDGAAWFERLYGGEAGLMKVIIQPNS